MNPNRWSITGSLLVSPALAALPCTAGDLSFEPSAAVLSGTGAESPTVFFSVSREPAGFLARIVPRIGLVGSDAAGTARFELEGDQRIALPSLWVAVDLSTGEFTAASPGLPVQSAELPSESLLTNAEGKPHGILVLAERFEVLVIRPSAPGAAGAWSGTVVDGSDLDADGAEDGYLGVVLSQLDPVEEGGPKPPSTLQSGDRIVAIDADRLVLWTAEITDEPAS